MANRRMFSPAVVSTDAFYELSFTSQALYFQLGMAADDDGFIGSPKSIARAMGAKIEDFEALIDAGYVIRFDSGASVIAHWKMQNQIKADRYHPTVYAQEIAMLCITESKEYTLEASAAAWPINGTGLDTDRIHNGTHMDTDCIQHGTGMDTEYSLGSIGKSNKPNINRGGKGYGGRSENHHATTSDSTEPHNATGTIGDAGSCAPLVSKEELKSYLLYLNNKVSDSIIEFAYRKLERENQLGEGWQRRACEYANIPYPA